MNHYGQQQERAQEVGERLTEFVQPLLQRLDEKLDKRLVNTFLLTMRAIITFRHSTYGLLLSELGGYILSPAQAPAGTKRLSNLLRSNKWAASIIETYLWEQATRRTEELEAQGEDVFIGWDESVIEKPESIALEGLCAVRSSKAHRLKRIKPGYYNPPGGRPIFVPGMQWVSLMVLGGHLPPVVATMRWWTTRGKHKTDRRTEEGKLLHRCSRYWGRRVVHIWDRGFASRAWLKRAAQHNLRFIVRWPKRYKLVNAKGEQVKAWQVTRGKRSLEHRDIWDIRRRCYRKTGIVFAPVSLPQQTQPLWLVVSRPGKGREPWYLLTNEPIETTADAWRIVFAYVRRWQVEVAFRFSKSELAMQSPRLWSWHNRLKLMMMVTLVYAFLLSLLLPILQALRDWLFRHFAHRTGKRYREASIPLYRLRAALSRLWTAHPPSLSFLPENSG
jgi:hypothetical protein